MNLFELLQGQLDENTISNLSKQIGAEPEQTAMATQGILSTLIGGLSKNAASPEGAAAISNALDRDHDGSLLDNLAGFLGGNKEVAPSNAINGEGIVKHILGDKADGAASMISQLSGMDMSKVGGLMTTLAPMIMATLGKTKQQGGLDVAGIASLLTNSVSNTAQAGGGSANPMMSLVSQFLDADKDGNVMDDLAGMGMKFLGGFFGKK